MRLWLLESRPGKWEPGHDMVRAFVIRSDTAHEARLIADANAGDENRDYGRPWREPAMTRCVHIGDARGRQRENALILRDYQAG